MKESQLSFKLKGRAQDLKGAWPCGRWPVAPFSCTSQTSLNPYTCTLGMFHPAAQLVWWTQSQEHVMGINWVMLVLCPCHETHRLFYLLWNEWHPQPQPLNLYQEGVTWMKLALVTHTSPISILYNRQVEQGCMHFTAGHNTGARNNHKVNVNYSVWLKKKIKNK